MDEYNKDLSRDNRPLSFNLAGSLCIFVVKKDNTKSVEYFKNLDGFRVCPETGDIHAIQFAHDRWIKIILEGYELRAMRSVRDNRSKMSSYAVEFFFDSNRKELQGIKITNEDHDKNKSIIQHSWGNTKTQVAQKTYYGAGVKKLDDVIKICNMEIESMEDTSINIPEWYTSKVA